MPELRPLVSVILLAAMAAGCASDRREVKMERPVFLRTNRDEKVFVSVRNASSCRDFPIEDVIRDDLAEKGYTLASDRAAADIELDVLIRFCGLEKDAIEGGKIVGGAVIGGAAGGIGAAAGRAARPGVAIGVLIGSILGAGTGYIFERQSLRNSFVSLVDLEIGQQGQPVRNTQVAARVRQKDITMEEAADMIARDVGKQIAGLF